MPYVGFFSLGCVLLLLWGKNPKQGELRLCTQVRISTEFETMAETGAFLFAMDDFRNFSGVKFGTIKDLQATLDCLLVTFHLRLEWI